MSGTHSYGTKLEVNHNGDGSTYVTVAGFVSSKGAMVIGAVKATDMQSANATLEKVPGMIDPGKRTMTVRATKAQYALFIGYLRVTKLWRISWPLISGESTPTRWVSSGFLTSIGDDYPDPESNETIMSDIELECTGLPTFTAGT